MEGGLLLCLREPPVCEKGMGGVRHQKRRREGEGEGDGERGGRWGGLRLDPREQPVCVFWGEGPVSVLPPRGVHMRARARPRGCVEGEFVWGDLERDGQGATHIYYEHVHTQLYV